MAFNSGSGGQFATIEDASLDQAYADAMASQQFDIALQFQQEISYRLQSVSGFLSGLFGSSRFPKYDAIQNNIGTYGQVSGAQSAAVQAAGNVANTAVSSVKSIASWSQGTLAIVAVIVVGGLVLWKGK